MVNGGPPANLLINQGVRDNGTEIGQIGWHPE